MVAQKSVSVQPLNEKNIVFLSSECLYFLELSVCISLRPAPSRFRSHNGQVRAVSEKKGLVTKTINHSHSPTTVVTNTAVENTNTETQWQIQQTRQIQIWWEM